MYQITLNIDQEKSYTSIHTKRILLLYMDTVPPEYTVSHP